MPDKTTVTTVTTTTTTSTAGRGGSGRSGGRGGGGGKGDGRKRGPPVKRDRSALEERKKKRAVLLQKLRRWRTRPSEKQC